jgi:hypothetical protein
MNPILRFAVLCILLFGFSGCSRAPEPILNVAHLDHLCAKRVVQGDTCTIVHIYSNAPHYEPADAPGEGIACLDDVARAIVVYIRAQEEAQIQGYDARIRGLLRFVLRMQQPDGTFVNFIRSDGSLNTTGETSKASFSFWAARGYWALGCAYRYYSVRDSAYAHRLREAFRRLYIPLSALEKRTGRFETVDSVVVPTWLVNGYAADATSELLLGIADYLSVEPDTVLLQHAQRLVEGILHMRFDEPDWLAGAFSPWPGVWHSWGNAQIQALARLYPYLEREDLLTAAETAAQSWRSRLVLIEPVHAYAVQENRLDPFPQIAYDIRTTALGFLELYHVTGNRDYAILAGLSASWFLGNNSGRTVMYDRETGRCYDGLDATGINPNSGAESTIEALYTLLEIQTVPEAARWLRGQKITPVDVNQITQNRDVAVRFGTDNARLEILWSSTTRSLTIRQQ